MLSDDEHFLVRMLAGVRESGDVHVHGRVIRIDDVKLAFFREVYALYPHAVLSVGTVLSVLSVFAVCAVDAVFAVLSYHLSEIYGGFVGVSDYQLSRFVDDGGYDSFAVCARIAFVALIAFVTFVALIALVALVTLVALRSVCAVCAVCSVRSVGADHLAEVFCSAVGVRGDEIAVGINGERFYSAFRFDFGRAGAQSSKPRRTADDAQKRKQSGQF